MKKLILSIALIVFGLLAPAQKIDTTGMSDYEKYYYAKEGMIDTIKIDTTKINLKKVETDDVYYRPSESNNIISTTYDRKGRPKKVKVEGYYEGYKDGYLEGIDYMSDYFLEDYYFANRIYRFNYGFGYYYNSPYWRFYYGFYDPFWYDPFYRPFYWDPWYWDRHYCHINYTYNYYGSTPYRSDYWNGNNNNISRNIATARRQTPSIYQKYQVSPSRSTGVDVRRSSPSTQTTVKPTYRNSSSITQQTQTINRRVEAPASKPIYRSSDRTYTPSYDKPTTSTRPRYNNTSTQRTYNSSDYESKPAYSAPQNRTQTQTRTSTQSRTYSAPKTSYPSPNRSVSVPSRNSGSNYSTPTRSSSSSYNGGSTSSSRSVSSSNSSSSSSNSTRSSSGGRR